MGRIIATVAVLTMAASASVAVAGQDKAKVRTDKGVLTLYEGGTFTGKRYEVDTLTREMETVFSISSVAVYPGESWEVCERPAFKEPCMTIDADQTNLNGIMVRSARRAKK